VDFSGQADVWNVTLFRWLVNKEADGFPFFYVEQTRQGQGAFSILDCWLAPLLTLT